MIISPFWLRDLGLVFGVGARSALNCRKLYQHALHVFLHLVQQIRESAQRALGGLF